MSARAWMLGTPLPPDLAADVRAVVELLRDGNTPRRDRHARASAVIVGLGETSLRHHFLGPLPRLGVGVVARKTVEVAVDLVVRSIGRPVRSVVGGMDDAQCLRLADELEAILYPDPHG